MCEWLCVCALVAGLSLSAFTAIGFVVYTRLLADAPVRTGSPPVKRITIAYKFAEAPRDPRGGALFGESRAIGPRLARIGVFYDDPAKVPGPHCRCAIGSILSEGENKADQELVKRYETSGFNVFSFPEVTHVVTTSLPHRAFFSALLRLTRVYPRLELYIKQRRLCAHPFLEIYRQGRVHFMAPLARQGDFYVPEARRAERRRSEQEDLHSDTEVSGAESNSEYSSGSGVALSDSREASPAASSANSADPGEGDWRGAASCEELDWEQDGARQEVGEAKTLEVPPQEWTGVVGGEE